jgi:hypothetical protein
MGEHHNYGASQNKGGAMTRHWGERDYEAVDSLEDHLVKWLEAHDVAGSILGQYSIYTALEEEHEKARLAWESQQLE